MGIPQYTKESYIEALNRDKQKIKDVKTLAKGLSLGKGFGLLKEKAESMLKEQAAKTLNKLGISDTLEKADQFLSDFGNLQNNLSEKLSTVPKSIKESINQEVRKFVTTNEIAMLSDKAKYYREAFACASKDNLLKKLQAAKGATDLFCDVIIQMNDNTVNFLSAVARYYTKDKAEEYLEDWIDLVLSSAASCKSELAQIKSLISVNTKPSDDRMKRLINYYKNPLDAKYLAFLESGVASAFFGFLGATDEAMDQAGGTSFFGPYDMETVTIPQQGWYIRNQLKSIDENIDRIYGLKDGYLSIIKDYVNMNNHIPWDELYEHLRIIEISANKLKTAHSNQREFQYNYRQIRKSLLTSIALIGQMKLASFIPTDLDDKVSDVNQRLGNFLDNVKGKVGRVSEGWDTVCKVGEIGKSIYDRVLDTFTHKKTDNSDISQPDKDSVSYNSRKEQQPHIEWADKILSSISSSTESLTKMIPAFNLKDSKSVKNFCNQATKALTKLNKNIAEQKAKTQAVIGIAQNIFKMFNPPISEDVKTGMKIIKDSAPEAYAAIENADLDLYKSYLENPIAAVTSAALQFKISQSVKDQSLSVLDSAWIHKITSFLDAKAVENRSKQEANDSALSKQLVDEGLKKREEKINKKISEAKNCDV